MFSISLYVGMTTVARTHGQLSAVSENRPGLRAIPRPAGPRTIRQLGIWARFVPASGTIQPQIPVWDDPAPETLGHAVTQGARHFRCRYAGGVTDQERPLSALPSPVARVAAFVAILVGGLAGGLIGYTLVQLQCHGSCASPTGIGTLVGALIAAGGMSVVAVLVLRAVGEWRQVEQRQVEQRQGSGRG